MAEENPSSSTLLDVLLDQSANQYSEKTQLKNNWSERHQIEDALRASEICYRRLFETAKDGILLLDAETGQITRVVSNPGEG